jgi:hypothetical protein
MEARWEASEARWEANEARWRENNAQHRELREDLRAVRDRLHREQVLRERNARHTLSLMQALFDKVRGLDARVTAVEGS